MSFENMMNILKNKFWLFSDFDRFSPVQWMTLKEHFFVFFQFICPSLQELNVI